MSRGNSSEIFNVKITRARFLAGINSQITNATHKAVMIEA